ncbi:hypothetical protein KY343_05530 [Candidatus Woesearchaeota archaeon]|nr:hypothetical protein [Candidatus Woesearchaeota archaeon]
MTIIDQLKGMEGWAIEAQESYSSDKKKALGNLSNIYNEARRRTYRHLRKMEGDVPQAIIEKLASIEAAVNELQKGKNIDGNFASLIKTIRESIDLAGQLGEADIYKKAIEWQKVFSDLISALYNLYNKFSSFPKGSLTMLKVAEFEDFSQRRNKAIILQCRKAAEDLHKIAMNIQVRGKDITEENAIVDLSAPLIFLDNWLGKTLKNTLLKVTYKLEEKNPLFEFIENLIIYIDKIIESFEPVLKECKALLKIIESEPRAEQDAHIHYIKPLERLLAHTR